jgi:MFS family permease
MSKTGETILFCIAFLSQILLISGLYVRQVVRDRRFVLENYPPSTHPRLYTQPVEYYVRKLRNSERVNLAIVIAGFTIIAVILGALFGAWDGGVFNPSRDQDWDYIIVTPFFVVQMLFVTLYTELSTFKHLKAMALAPPPRVRTTVLHRQRLKDFVSPVMLVVMALVNAGFVVFLLGYRRHGFPWFTAAGNIVGVVCMLLVFCGAVAFALYAAKPDPYQAREDRLAWRKRLVQAMLTFCIVYPVLIMATLIIKSVNHDLLEPFVTSLYCVGCALAMLWPRFRADQMDFDVYRPSGAPDSTRDASARISAS